MRGGSRSGTSTIRPGFASRPASVGREDGLRLKDAYITAAARCAPPQNKPARQELANCRPYLERELELLVGIRVVVALGKLAHDTYLGILRSQGAIVSRAGYPFGHAVTHKLPGGLPLLIDSYHPSRQNTQTGRLSEAMLRGVFERARRGISG